MHVAYFCFSKEDINNLTVLLEQYCLFKDFKFVIEKFNSENGFFKAFEPKRYKLIFFDTTENPKECFLIANKIRKLDGNTLMIFFADNKYYAYDAFLLYAADYILKPIKFERLERTLNRILKNVNMSKKFINVNCNKINTKINVSNIMYIEVIGNVSCIHLASGNLVKVYITLSELEEMLKYNPLFLRTHKSYIINMEYVSEMQGYGFIMKNGDIVSIRKNNCKEIKSLYRRYSLGKSAMLAERKK